MKILHLLYESKGDFFGIGGVGIRAYEIYNYLKERHEVTLLCKKYPGAKDGEIEGLRHIFVGTESKSFANALLSYAYHAVRFVKIYGNKFDIIIEDFSPATPTFLHAFTKRPIVLQVQGYTGRYYFKKYNPVYALVLYVLEHLRSRFYNNFIFMSTETVKRLLPGVSSDSFTHPPIPPLIRGGWGAKCIEVIPNGVSPELLDMPPDSGDYILYLGRVDIYGKGLDILINAYKEFYESFPDIRLVIAGDGRDMKRFKTELIKLPDNVRKNMELLGWVTGDKKMDIITQALFVVFPSRHEVQPIAVLEAMACGKTIIVSDIPEFNFVVEKRAGISFEVGDSRALAQSMRYMMTSNDRKEMGLRGRDLVRNFTWDKIAMKYEEFLCRVLER